MSIRGTKRCYAEAFHRLQLGIWGYDKRLFSAVHLTARDGDDNSPERLLINGCKVYVHLFYPTKHFEFPE